MASALAVFVGALGIACVTWPLKAVTFCRWYHRKKTQWIQELPLADLIMRPWVPTYFRYMGLFLCIGALGLAWIATNKG